jgi:effector-binding domain-containing protein
MNKSNLKIVVFTLLTVIILGGLWLFVKPHDYTATFKTKALPGVINQTIKVWNTTQKDAKISSKKDDLKVEQELHFNDSTFIYQWEFLPLNDSITKVNIGITDVNNSLKNRFFNFFGNTDFKKRTKKTVYKFIDVLDQHLKKIKVSINEESVTPAVFCAYVSLKSLQIQKAKGMMQNYEFLNSFLIQHNFKFDGLPMIEITDWNRKTDSISYNFCYPIIKKDSLPTHPNIKFKNFESRKALKATYHGNYITSDRAWYALLKHAKSNKIEVYETPIEVFFNNPNYSGNELNWKSEVYMPIKQKE